MIENNNHPELPVSRLEYFHNQSLFQTLFWKPRYNRSSPLNVHVPFLFWITTVVDPLRAAILGCGEGSAHFAVCQALDKLASGGVCEGFGFWSKPDGELLELPLFISEHQDMLYESISSVYCNLNKESIIDRLSKDPADLLIVDLQSTPGSIDISDYDLQHCIKKDGIFIFHGIERDEDRFISGHNLNGILGKKNKVEIKSGSGLLLIANGELSASPLSSLFKASSNGQLSEDVNLIFRRCGLGVASAIDARERGDALDRIKKTLDVTASNLNEARIAKEKLSATQNVSNLKITNLQAEVVVVREQIAALEAERAKLQNAHNIALTEERKLRADLKREGKALRLEVSTLVSERAKLQDAHNIALTEERKLQADLKREGKALREQIGALEAELAKLEKAHNIVLTEAQEIQLNLKEEGKALRLEVSTLVSERAKLQQALEIALRETEEQRNIRFFETASLTKIAEELREQLAEAEEQLEKVGEDRDHLMRDIEKMESSLHEIRESTSWRVTTPLRALKTAFQRVFPRID